MSYVTVTLRQDERDALHELAFRELRAPRDQARYILRKELKRLRLLPGASATPQKQQQEVSNVSRVD